ncbi:MAG: NAD(P)/FAD-dependent oxidoreductase [Candidatus Omnitrophica bacterium]|nr:NAD(P)/FAD-dependent oxidoreductase [Candidatus Omnitrophota bacterium]
MEYDAIIIGAGVGGLACGLKLSCEGKKVLLLEKQPLPGGFATTFSRKGFIFESAVHCVDTLTKTEEIRTFMDESGITKEITFINLDDFARIIYPDYDFVADFKQDNFISVLKSNFPQERKNIDRFFRAFDKFHRQFERFNHSRLPLGIKLLISPLAYPMIISTSISTAAQFVDKYIKDAKLKAIVTDIWRFTGLPPSRLSAIYFLLVFECYYYNSTAYVKGGFIKLFQAMVERIKESGSEVRFNTSVVKIITRDGKRVKSVVTDKGEEFSARTIVSNANAIDTLTKMLDVDAVKEEYGRKLASLEKSVSAFQIYLGLSVPAKTLGMNHSIFSISNAYDHDENYNYSMSGDYDRCSLELVDHAQIDPALAPQGKGTLLIMTLDNYANWRDLSEEQYQAKKKEVADKFIKRSEKYLPGLSKYIEVMEIATPRTMARFGTSPEGAIYGFAQTIGQSGINRLAQETKVKGLFLAGAWTMPGGGAHACFLSGIMAGELASKYLK